MDCSYNDTISLLLTASKTFCVKTTHPSTVEKYQKTQQWQSYGRRIFLKSRNRTD